MKVRITTEIELSTGDYEVIINNISQPGQGIDARLLRRVWLAVIHQISMSLRGNKEIKDCIVVN